MSSSITATAAVVHEFGGPEKLQVEEITLPALQPTQVLISVKAAGVNPVETYIRSGTYPRLPTLPWIPGHDCAGIVESVGKDVTTVKEGDRVYTTVTVTGAYANKTIAEASKVHVLPEHLSFEQGCAVSVPYATAHWALQRAGVQPGETVLVHGASGGVGLATVQIARNTCTLFGTASTQEGKDLVLHHGAQRVFDHSKPGYMDEVVSATGGRGVDVIIEMLANVNLENDLRILALRGRVVIVGCRGSIEINPRLLMGKLSDIRGVALALCPPDDRARIDAVVNMGLHQKYLSPVVGKKYSLQDVSTAHTDIIAHSHHGKMVLQC